MEDDLNIIPILDIPPWSEQWDFYKYYYISPFFTSPEFITIFVNSWTFPMCFFSSFNSPNVLSQYSHLTSVCFFNYAIELFHFEKYFFTCGSFPIVLIVVYPAEVLAIAFLVVKVSFSLSLIRVDVSFIFCSFTLLPQPKVT